MRRTVLMGLIALNALCLPGAWAAEHEHAVDARQALRLTPEEAAHVSLEMRGFLDNVQKIVAAAASNDAAALAKAARASGVAAAHAVPPGLRAKLPAEFKRLGQATHMGFDDLARDAESLGDIPHALGQLGGLMRNCVACHQTFRVEVKSGKH